MEKIYKILASLLNILVVFYHAVHRIWIAVRTSLEKKKVVRNANRRLQSEKIARLKEDKHK